MITLQQFWMGRDAQYPLELSTEVRANAIRTVGLANDLLTRLQAVGVPLVGRTDTAWGLVSSGWRPAAVNAATPNAAKRSNHMLGKAVDIFDPNGKIDAWLMTPAGQDALKALGLWLEHPDSTPRWSHWQIVPPGSGNRVFRP